MSFFAARKNTPLAQYTTLPKEFPQTGEVTEDRGPSSLLKYILCKANATIAAGNWVKIDAANMTASTELLVIPTAAVPDVVLGLPAGGQAVANGSYFWCQIYGLAALGTVLTTAAVTAGGALTASATAGALQMNTSTAAQQNVIAIALQANSSGTPQLLLVHISSSYNP